jgi:hypothetical protein
VLTPEEIKLVKSTVYFGKDHWIYKDEPHCIANLAIHRGASFSYSTSYGIIVADKDDIVNRAATDLAIWLNCYTHDGKPSPILLCELLWKKKHKIFEQATY